MLLAARRAWFRRIGGAGIGLFAVRGLLASDDAEAPELAAIRERGRRRGLPGFRSIDSEHYRGVGDAPADFLGKAVTLCEGLARDYLKHFKAKGLEASEPTSRLYLIALADAEAFASFLGFDPGEDVGGVYDLDSNHLVIFDNRREHPNDPTALRANTVALYHEATHQLTFNTGLLDRAADVPLAISEGLGQYGEVRRPDGRTPIGRVNIDRLGVLINAENDGLAWQSVNQLFDDGTFAAGDSVQMAYAQSWLMVHMLVAQRKNVERFRSYLEAIRPRRDSRERLADVRAHLGDPERLGAEMLAYGRKLIRS